MVLATLLATALPTATAVDDPRRVELIGQARAGSVETPAGPRSERTYPSQELAADDWLDRSNGLSTRLGGPVATPLPTPVPVDPDATPLAAPPAPEHARATSLLFPVPGGWVSQPFRAGHEGLDIAAPVGSPVVAASGGTVTWAGWRNNGGGLVIEITHGNGMATVYNHLGSIGVAAGQVLPAGAVIGGMGCSGACRGPHVQFDVRVNGVLVDPRSLLRG
jgi:murein DD-endopeptidase MepM/ murein hydrolase activator NlpD